MQIYSRTENKAWVTTNYLYSGLLTALKAKNTKNLIDESKADINRGG